MPPLLLLLVLPLTVIGGYLLGSILFGIVVCRAVGKDPRLVGSGRTGGTNVYRTAGAVPAILTVLGDSLKGAAAVWLAHWLVPGPLGPMAMSLAALAAILGHNRSVYHGFAGGAGSSPNLGAYLALAPHPWWFVAVAVASGLVWKVSRMASVASLTLSGLILLTIAGFVYTGQGPVELLVYGVGQLALVGWALRPNIRRLREGREITVDRA